MKAKPAAKKPAKPGKWVVIENPTTHDHWDEFLREDGQWRPWHEETFHNAARPRQVRYRKA